MTATNAWYPPDPNVAAAVQTDVDAVEGSRASVARLSWTAVEAATASTTGVHAAVTDNGTAQTITTAITDPPCPRNITATAGGTAGDIKAVQVVVTGTNYLDEVITETLPAFTVNTAGTVAGAKAFKTVTSVVIPAHDGNGATTAIGFGDLLGMPYELARKTVLSAYLGNVLESTAATVVVSSSAIESNTIDLHSALNGSVVDAYLLVP